MSLRIVNSEYIETLQGIVSQERNDSQARLIEKDTIIRSLRIELAQLKVENERMRLVLMPLGSPAGQMYAAKFHEQPKAAPVDPLTFSGPLDWSGELNKMLQEEEDGIRKSGRVQEHEPRTNDGA